MTEAETSGRGGMRTWLKVVLFASLALNLLVAGLVAGVLLRGPDHRAMRDGRDPVAPYTRAFTEEQRRALGRALREEFGRVRDAGRGDLLEEYREALAILRADPFDPAALDAVLERQAVRAEARRMAGQAVLGAHIAAMTPEARAAFADRLEALVSEMAARRDRWRRD